MAGLIARTAGKGLRYEAALVARLEGGRSEAAGSTLNFSNADAVTLGRGAGHQFCELSRHQRRPGSPVQKSFGRRRRQGFRRSFTDVTWTISAA